MDLRRSGCQRRFWLGLQLIFKINERSFYKVPGKAGDRYGQYELSSEFDHGIGEPAVPEEGDR